MMLPSSSDSSSCNTASLYHSCPGLHVLTLGKHCPGLLPWRNNNPILHLLPPDEFGSSHYGGSGGWGFNSSLTRCGTGFSSVVLIYLTGRAAFSARNPVPSYLEISSTDKLVHFLRCNFSQVLGIQQKETRFLPKILTKRPISVSD